MTDARIKMAQIPEKSIPLDNRVGGAPGVMIEDNEATVFCLPGVPSELKFIFENSLVPWIRDRVRWKFYEKIVGFGLSDESVFAPAIDVVMKKHRGVYIKSMPKTYGTSKILRVWVSMRCENLEEAKEHVEDAIDDLENTTGLKARYVEE